LHGLKIFDSPNLSKYSSQAIQRCLLRDDRGSITSLWHAFLAEREAASA
jgi:hypothetical protein